MELQYLLCSRATSCITSVASGEAFALGSCGGRSPNRTLTHSTADVLMASTSYPPCRQSQCEHSDLRDCTKKTRPLGPALACHLPERKAYVSYGQIRQESHGIHPTYLRLPHHIPPRLKDRPMAQCRTRSYLSCYSLPITKSGLNSCAIGMTIRWKA